MITRYQELKVWQKSIDLIEQIYVIINRFPKTETFALVDQLKRSAVSIASNIAEGSERGTKKENIHFLYIAKGSAAELETQLIISERLHFISKDDFTTIHGTILEVLKMLSSYISYHKTHS
ncbi:MAG: four helix bundle protein [Candidatus Absconditabacterales bacterium]